MNDADKINLLTEMVLILWEDRLTLAMQKEHESSMYRTVVRDNFDHIRAENEVYQRRLAEAGMYPE